MDMGKPILSTPPPEQRYKRNVCKILRTIEDLLKLQIRNISISADIQIPFNIRNPRN